MQEAQVAQPELPDFISILADKFPGQTFFRYLRPWESLAYSLIIIFILAVAFYFAGRRKKKVPGRLQAAAELVCGGIDDFVCGILGAQGRRFTPFIGTLFIYIIFMNIFGLIPFMKPPTSSLSTTLALSICVFFYVQYTAIKELGFLGYLDHLAGRPRGFLAACVILPLFIFILHIISELIKPLSLSLRLRSNIWGDDMLLAVLAHFGISGLPLLFLNLLSGLLVAIVQAVVFSLLSLIYFALVLPQEEH